MGLRRETLTRDKSPMVETAGTFDAFFHDTYEPLLRALYLVTGNRHESEDLAQEAFFRVYERWERVRATANPAGYAYRVALNAHRSQLRRLAAMARRTVHRPEPDQVGASDERDSIRRALAKLPKGQREALVLVEWVGLTDREAAEILSVRPEAVRMQVSRARHRLRDELRGDSDEN